MAVKGKQVCVNLCLKEITDHAPETLSSVPQKLESMICIDKTHQINKYKHEMTSISYTVIYKLLNNIKTNLEQIFPVYVEDLIHNKPTIKLNRFNR